jgi:hypothetical protein
MFRRRGNQSARERATEYATCKDFRRIFTEDMAGLHLLAYLLTADMAKAERCFVAGLEDSIHGNLVFKQWARAWSKRTIIQNAIKMVKPVADGEMPVEPEITPAQSWAGADNPLVSLVMEWSPFERFVFVMSVLEGYSVRECSTLLSCRDQDVMGAKSQVLQLLAKEPERAGSMVQLGGLSWTGLFTSPRAA